MLLRTLFVLITLTLTACNGAAVKPEGAPESSAASETQADQTAQSPVKPERRVTSGANQVQPELAKPSAMAQLQQRLTSVQEHLYQLKTQTAEMQQQNQVLLLQMQSMKDALASSLPQTEGEETAPEPMSEDAVNALLEQLGLVAHELQSTQGTSQFEVKSAYTAKGQWVLIRYNRYTGESWLADQGQWNPLQESGAIELSHYTVVLLRADKDVKGYVAARLDTSNGDTWWLKQDVWQPFNAQ